MYTFIQQGFIPLIKNDSKTFKMLQNIFILNKCCSSSSTRILKQMFYQFPHLIKLHNHFQVIIIRNVIEYQISILEWFLKDHVALE